MRILRKFSLLLFSIILFTLLSFTLNISNAEATVLSMSPYNYESYMKGVIQTENHNKDIDIIIKDSFPTFSISPSTYNSIVGGKKNYTILEVTPRSYLGDPTTEVSDLMKNVDVVKGIYSRLITTYDVSTKHFIMNLPNFNVELMTIKEFVSNRDNIAGKYDAIVFSAAGNYNPGTSVSCTFNYDINQLVYKKVYDQNNRLRYDGYFLGNNYHGEGKVYDQNGRLTYNGQFNEGQYHGFGDLYDQNGRLTYTGNWNNGNKECYGKFYDQNGRLRYEGKWLNNKRHGYGTSYLDNGYFEYEGYWEHDIKNEDQKPHDLLNDITELKANEVLNNYVKKGLPVFIHNDVFAYSNSNFNQHFKDLNLTYNNVFTLDYPMLNKASNIGFQETIAIMSITELLSTKPNLNFTNKPIDYYTDTTKTYMPDEVVKFNFELTNKDSANLYLYLDVNQNDVIETKELANAVVLTRGLNEVSLKIPNIYSGLLNYRMVVENNSLTSSYEGTLRVKGEVRDIKVINIVSEMVYNKDNLLDQTLIDKYFTNNGDYNITIDSCPIDQFSKNRSSCSHYTIMDNYDVVLLGQDIFDKPLNVHVYESIQAQVDLGKPMIFTSSITKGNDKWVKYFSDDLILAETRTDLYKINNADRLQIMNKNSYNSYPFYMAKENLIVPEDLNYAFNEQYQVNLEQSDLVPLLTMYKSNPYNLDRFDAYNNFYYMKSNNVVYLNIGNNSFKVYKDIEHKLLANAVTNLYINKNAQEVNFDEFLYINSSTDYNNALINITDTLNLDLTILTNREETNYKYRIKIGANTVKEDQITVNTQTFIPLSNIALPNVNEVKKAYISIEVMDLQGRRIKETGFNVYVANINSYLGVTSTLSKVSTNIVDSKIGIGSVYNLNYNINFLTQDLNYLNTNDLPSQLVLKNIIFEEVLPANIAVEPLNSTFVVSTNEQGQTIVRKTLSDVTLTYQNGKYVPNIANTTVTIPVKVNATGDYNLNQSTIKLNGITSDFDQMSIGGVTFKAVKLLDATLVDFTFDNYLFIPFMKDMSNYEILLDKFNIDSEVHVTSVEFNLINPTGNFTLDKTTNIITATGVGTQEVEIIVTDIFGNRVREVFFVYSYEPVSAIQLSNLSLYTNQNMILLPLNVLPNLNKESLSYTITNLNSGSTNQVVEISYNAEENRYYVKPLATGSVEVVFSGYDVYGNVVSTSAVIVVNEHTSVRFVKDYISLFVNKTYTDSFANTYFEACTIGTTPCTYNDITWKSLNTSVATVATNGDITAISAGFAIIEALLPNGDKAQLLVNVSDYISSNNGFDSVKLTERNLYDEEYYNLLDFMDLSGVDTSLVTFEFTSEVLQGNGTVTIDPVTHQMNVTVLDNNNLQVKVTVKMTQTTDGEPVEVIHSTVFTILAKNNNGKH